MPAHAQPSPTATTTTTAAPICIAISRQVAAGGAPLGERLAERLGFVYLDREILRAAARQLGCSEDKIACFDERVSGFWERFIGTFAVGPPEHTYTPFPSSADVRDRQLFTVQTRVIQELVARRDSVVIGRAGFHILRDHPGLISVFLHAPIDSRVPTFRELFHIESDAKARQMLERADQERDRFVREMTGRTLCDSRNYDLCIDTSQSGMELAERLVVEMVEHVRRRLSVAG